MKKSKKIWLGISASAILAGFLLIYISRVFGGSDGFYMGSDWRLQRINEEHSEYISEPLKNIKEIIVNMSSYDIKIKPSKDEYFYAEIKSFVDEEMEIDIEHETLSIMQKPKVRFLYFNIFGWEYSYEIILYVPEGAEINNLKVTTLDGNIDSEVNMTSKVTELKTSSGNITATGLTSKNTDLKTSDGNITIEGIFLDETTLKTSSGDITAAGSYMKKASFKTSDGSIRFTTDTERGNSSITAKTSDGVVRINDNKVGKYLQEINSSNHEFQLKTSSGNITIDMK